MNPWQEIDRAADNAAYDDPAELDERVEAAIERLANDAREIRRVTALLRQSSDELAGAREADEQDEADEDEFTSCAHPGARGCQRCDACACWGDDEYHRRVDEGLI